SGAERCSTAAQISNRPTAAGSWPRGSIASLIIRRNHSMDQLPSLTRRDLLKLGGTALAVGAPAGFVTAHPAEAQSPKRGGRFRLRSHVPPVHFDPHQTLAFSTMIPLSFAYSRLVKIKGGSAVVPGTQPVEADLAESWERQGDNVYAFKLRKGVRWHNK